MEIPFMQAFTEEEKYWSPPFFLYSLTETFAKFLFPRQPKPQTQVFGCFRLFPPPITP